MDMKKITLLMKVNKEDLKMKRINKYYWLDKGYEMVDGGLKRSHQQINGIKTYINGLLGTYVIASIVDSIYLEIDTIWKLIIVFLPVLLVKWSLYYGDISILPEPKSFYPDSAESSEETYYEYLNESLLHVKKMKKFALASTVILLITLVSVTWLTIQSKTKINKEENELKITKEKLAKVQNELKLFYTKDIYEINTQYSNNTIYIAAILPKNKIIKIWATNKFDSIIYPKKELLIGSSGELHYDFTVNNNDSLNIHLDYQLSNNEYRQMKKIVVKK